jgi:hypothetical protein
VGRKPAIYKHEGRGIFRDSYKRPASCILAGRGSRAQCRNRGLVSGRGASVVMVGEAGVQSSKSRCHEAESLFLTLW